MYTLIYSSYNQYEFIFYFLKYSSNLKIIVLIYCDMSLVCIKNAIKTIMACVYFIIWYYTYNVPILRLLHLIYTVGDTRRGIFMPLVYKL